MNSTEEKQQESKVDAQHITTTPSTPWNRYTLEDIMMDKDKQKHTFNEDFIKCSNANWKKQFSRVMGAVPDPSEIIPSWFYLGNKINISDKKCLEELGITHILNVSDTLPCYFINDFIYGQIKVDDIETANIGQYFDAATEFIDLVNPKFNTNNNDQHLKLFVHCAVGKSRSATIVIQYLMRRGVDFNNNHWLQKIQKFGLIDNFMNDDIIYKRSLNCFNPNNVFCCRCCICWFKCCLCCKCYNQTNNDDDDDEKVENEYAAFKNVCNIGTMSLRNSCDYVQKCRSLIFPNESFATQLAEFEESLRNGVSTFELSNVWKLNGVKPRRCYDHLKEKKKSYDSMDEM